MPNPKQLRFNPYIRGQISFLLGGIAVACLLLPSCFSQNYDPAKNQHPKAPVTESSSGGTPVRVASIVLGVVGVGSGLLGWRREKPPLLAVLGTVLGLVAIFWPYFVLAYTFVIAVLAVLFVIGTMFLP